MKDDVKKVLNLISKHWKLFYFYIEGGDAEDGYVLAQNKEDIKDLVGDENVNLLYGPRYGIKSYKIEQLKVNKHILKQRYYKEVKKEKLNDFKKIDMNKQKRESFYLDKNNVNEISMAKYIVDNFEEKPLLISKFQWNKVHK
jgi:hypothetical protein